MQAFIDFLVNNYLWFLVISLILVFALIGYLVDTNEKKDKDIYLDKKEGNKEIEESVSHSMEVLEDLEK